MRYTLLLLLICLIGCSESETESSSEEPSTQKLQAKDGTMLAQAMHGAIVAMDTTDSYAIKPYNSVCEQVLTQYFVNEVRDTAGLVQLMEVYPEVIRQQENQIELAKQIREIDEGVNLVALNLEVEEAVLPVLMGFNDLVVMIYEGEPFDAIKNKYDEVLPVAQNYKDCVERFEKAERTLRQKYRF